VVCARNHGRRPAHVPREADGAAFPSGSWKKKALRGPARTEMLQARSEKDRPAPIVFPLGAENRVEKVVAVGRKSTTITAVFEPVVGSDSVSRSGSAPTIVRVFS